MTAQTDQGVCCLMTMTNAAVPALRHGGSATAFWIGSFCMGLPHADTSFALTTNRDSAHETALGAYSVLTKRNINTPPMCNTST